MHLSDFISENMESIVQAWEDFARTIEPPALTMDRTALRDHASAMLRVIAKDLTAGQTALQQSEKSKGHGLRDSDDTAAESHADARLLSGYTIEQIVSEFRALRASVLRLWSNSAEKRQDVDPWTSSASMKRSIRHWQNRWAVMPARSRSRRICFSQFLATICVTLWNIPSWVRA